MTTATQAEFARQMNWNRSSVTRAKNNGRLVMSGDLVDVEASLQRLEKTASRIDVAERHAADREAKQTTPPTPPMPQAATTDKKDEEIGYSYQAARAVKERYAALQAKADYEQSI